jgi:two-component SAPR family response regulator
MPKLTCVIVEDEIISLTMVQALAEKTKLLDIQNTFPSAVEAIKWLVDNPVDLLFLDVEMPGMTGIELVRALTYKPQVIIISGKANYAVDAFELAVTDYLLKPVKDYTRFCSPSIRRLPITSRISRVRVMTPSLYG